MRRYRSPSQHQTSRPVTSKGNRARWFDDVRRGRRSECSHETRRAFARGPRALRFALPPVAIACALPGGIVAPLATISGPARDCSFARKHDDLGVNPMGATPPIPVLLGETGTEFQRGMVSCGRGEHSALSRAYPLARGPLRLPPSLQVRGATPAGNLPSYNLGAGRVGPGDTLDRPHPEGGRALLGRRGADLSQGIQRGAPPQNVRRS
jgi:hypothetical protein